MEAVRGRVWIFSGIAQSKESNSRAMAWNLHVFENCLTYENIETSGMIMLSWYHYDLSCRKFSSFLENSIIYSFKREEEECLWKVCTSLYSASNVQAVRCHSRVQPPLIYPPQRRILSWAISQYEAVVSSQYNSPSLLYLPFSKCFLNFLVPSSWMGYTHLN